MTQVREPMKALERRIPVRRVLRNAPKRHPVDEGATSQPSSCAACEYYVSSGRKRPFAVLMLGDRSAP